MKTLSADLAFKSLLFFVFLRGLRGELLFPVRIKEPGDGPTDCAGLGGSATLDSPYGFAVCLD